MVEGYEDPLGFWTERIIETWDSGGNQSPRLGILAETNHIDLGF